MEYPKINNINKPSFFLPVKKYLFDNVPMYFFSDPGCSVLSIDLIFEVDFNILHSSPNLAVNFSNLFLTSGTR